MEELRSTEILDREIQAEARKKAEKIIRSAEAEAKSIEDNVSERLAEAKAEKQERNAQKLESFRKDLEAALPLEKERFLVSYIQSSIDRGMDEYFSSLSDEEILSLFAEMLSGFDGKIKNQSFRAFVYGLDMEKTENALRKKISLLSAEKTEFNKILPEKSFGIKNPKGIILETEDRKIRLRLTLSEIVSQFEEDFRQELYAELFGGRI